MFGLARDQVARINAVHIGDPGLRPIEVEILFVDATGAVLGRDVQTVEPGSGRVLRPAVRREPRGEPDRGASRSSASWRVPTSPSGSRSKSSIRPARKTTIFMSNPNI